MVALVVKSPPGNTGDAKDVGSILWVEKIPWRRKWQPKYSCLENTLDREACGLQSIGSQRAGHD